MPAAGVPERGRGARLLGEPRSTAWSRGPSSAAGGWRALARAARHGASLERAPTRGGRLGGCPAPMAVRTPADLGDEPFQGRRRLVAAAYGEQDLLALGEGVVDAAEDLQ